MTSTALTTMQEDEKLKGYLVRAKDDIAALLPKHIPADRMIKAALVCAVRNPDVGKCTRESILLSVMRASQLGLEIGEDAHLVPVNKKQGNEYIKVCELWPDYRGLMRLAMQGGLVRHMVPYVVRQGDEFHYELGLNETLQHRPNSKHGAPLVAAYAIITLRFGAKTFHVMEAAEIEARRAKSKQWGPDKVKDCPEWFAKKTVIRDWLNRQPKTAKLSEALEQEERVDVGALEPLALPAGVDADGVVWEPAA